MITNSSVSGSSVPTWLVDPISDTDMSCVVHDLSTWFETNADGESTLNPLGTSGTFVITIGWEQAECEKIQCSEINVSTKTITFAQRGYDGTNAKSHAAGTLRNPNVFPVFAAADLVEIDDLITEIDSAVQDLADEVEGLQTSVQTAQSAAETAQSTAETAQTTAETAQATAETAQTTAETAQATAESKVASVSGDGATITVSGTEIDPVISVTTNVFDPYGAAASKVASVTAADGTIQIAGTATAPTVAVGTVPYSQISGTPSSLPPSGSAGGDLSGTYPNPTLGAVGTSGTKGSASSVPVFVTDSKGRVTSSTDTPILITESQVTNLTTDLAAKLPLAGGTMSGSIDLNGHALNNVTALDMDGLSGATATTRFVGATSAGAPTSGTFAVGDFVIDQTAMLWICITAGSPGTWAPASNLDLTSRSSNATANIGEITYCTGGGGFTITLPAGAPDGSNYGIINASNSAVSIKGGTNSLKIAGTNYGGGISYSVAVNGTYSFILQSGSWYCYSTNDIGDMVNYSDVAISAFGTATAAIAMGSHKITGLANGTASSDAAAFGQIPSSLPPSGAAGGDLSGTYPNPSVVQGSTTVAGKLQLIDSISSTSIALAATANAVKTAYDLANGRVSTSRSISTTSPLSGGGDLSADRTLSIQDASTTQKGAVQLSSATNSTSTTLAATASAVKTAWDLANAALPLSGGTMSGDINLNSVARLKNLIAPAAINDALRAGDFGSTVGPLFHTNVFGVPVLAWTVDPINAGAASGPTSNRTYWEAIYIPYAMTVTGVVFNISTVGASITSSSIGLYNSSGTRLVQQSNANAAFGSALTGTVTVAFSTTYAVATAGVYWIGFHVAATTTPTLIRAQSGNAAAVNMNINATAGTLNFRSGYSGTGAIPASFPAGTPTLDVAPWLFGLY